MMVINKPVGTQQKLRNGEEEDCDTCNRKAAVKLTEKSGNGFYCEHCLDKAIENQK